MSAAGLKDLYERLRRAMLKRPEFGRSAGQARVRLGDDFCCEVEEGAWRTRIDHSVEGGGQGTAPHSEQMMRAALVACLAVGYRNWSARLDVPIGEIEVDVMCEMDVRGQMGIADVAVGWHSIVVDVCIASTAPEADVRRVVETADRLSPLLANLTLAIHRVHRLRIVHPKRPGVDSGASRCP